MNKIWTFGDSYAQYRYPDRTNWISILETLLGYKARPRAVGGSSLDYTYYAVDKDLKFIGDDIVIIALTSINRHWLINNSPELGSYPMLAANGKFNAEQLQFFQQYYVNANVELNTILLKNFLAALSVRSAVMKIKPIIFSSFPRTTELVLKTLDSTLNIVPGNLFDQITKIEFANAQDADNFNKDTRINHMCNGNHEILAEKIFKFINDGTPIVLDGFLADKAYVKDKTVYEK
jgi:hypothetical protein